MPSSGGFRRINLTGQSARTRVRRIYPDLDDTKWFASRLTTLRGQTDALRNVAVHRHLPRLGDLDGLSVCDDMNPSKQLDATTLSTYLAVIGELGSLFPADTYNEWVRARLIKAGFLCPNIVYGGWHSFEPDILYASLLTSFFVASRYRRKDAIWKYSCSCQGGKTGLPRGSGGCFRCEAYINR